MKIEVFDKKENDLGYLTLAFLTGTASELMQEVVRIEEWLEKKPTGEWAWFARYSSDAAIAAGIKAQQDFASNPLVASIKLCDIPFIIDFKRAEDAVLFKMFFSDDNE